MEMKTSAYPQHFRDPHGVVEIFILLSCCKAKFSLSLTFPYTVSAPSSEIVSKKIKEKTKLSRIFVSLKMGPVDCPETFVIN
jgi:hypothetical protein